MILKKATEEKLRWRPHSHSVINARSDRRQVPRVHQDVGYEMFVCRGDPFSQPKLKII